MTEDAASLITLLLFIAAWFALGLLVGYLLGWTCARRKGTGTVPVERKEQ